MKRILIMDENSAFGDLLAKMAGDEFEVFKAQDASTGVQQAIDTKPDLILLDTEISRGTGVAVLRRLQSADETEDIPVIILTGQFFEKHMQRVLQREPNVTSFLDKSVGTSVLLVHIQQALDELK